MDASGKLLEGEALGWMGTSVDVGLVAIGLRDYQLVGISSHPE